MSWHNTGSHEDEGEMYIRRKLKELYSSDQPQHACDGRGSDGLSAWTDTTFPFQLAATIKDEIEALWADNCEFIEAYKGEFARPKEKALVGLLFGAPGIGKTRTLLELKNIIPCGGNYAFISFNGGTSYSVEENNMGIDKMIAVRILFGSFESRKPEADFHQWVRHFDLKRRFSSKDCLRIVRSGEGPFCLAIDELTKLGPVAQYACDEITKLVLTSQIIVFLGGRLLADWEDALNSSNIPGSFLSLAPFTSTQISNILDQLQHPYKRYFRGWRANPELRDLLLRIGGVPRLLEQFVIRCEKKFRHQLPPWDWEKMDALLEQIDPTPGLSWAYVNQLVRDIVLRREVGRRDPVINYGTRMTYDLLQSLGHIQLLRGNSKRAFLIYVPLLRFRQWLAQLIDRTATREFRILEKLMNRKIEWGRWTDFEQVVAEYFQLLIHLWSQEAREDPPSPATWRKFFSTSIPEWPNDIKFINESPAVITSLAQFPLCGSIIREPRNHKEYNFDDGSVFLNGAGAPFADVFFTCRHGEDEAKCLVAIQCKLFQKTKMNKKTVNAEVKKNWDAMESYRGAFSDCSSMYTVILVSTPYSNCEEEDEVMMEEGGREGEDEEDDNNQKESRESMEVDEPIPPHMSTGPDRCKTYIILGQEELQKFFPQPLRDYTFRVMVSGRLNINCAPLKDVRKLLKLTEGQVNKFAEERELKGGFKSKDDLPFDVNPDQLELLEF